ncbi:hypothetical protein B4U80_07146, partial [Leptotrombidium deliense]
MKLLIKIVIKVFPKSVSDLKTLNKIRDNFTFDVDFWSDIHHTQNAVLFHVSPRYKRNVVKFLNNAGVNHSTVIEDLGIWIKSIHEYASRRKAVNVLKSDEIDFEHYYTYEQIVDILKSLEQKFASIAKYTSIGVTYEHRNIPAIVVNSDVSKQKPAIVFECGIHAREWISPATCLWIVNDLLATNSGNELIKNHSFHFLLLTNPDGYQFTWTHNRLWRKNRSPGKFNLWYDCSGIDLNRNFDVSYATLGSTDNQCDYTYHGKYAFSELETQAIRNYVINLTKRTNIDIYFSVHSFAQIWLYPYAFTDETPENNDDYIRLSKLAMKAISDTNGEKYSFGRVAKVMYKSGGCSI